MPDWPTWSAASEPLTEQQFVEAMNKVARQKPTPTRLVMSAGALRSGREAARRSMAIGLGLLRLRNQCSRWRWIRRRWLTKEAHEAMRDGTMLAQTFGLEWPPEEPPPAPPSGGTLTDLIKGDEAV